MEVVLVNASVLALPPSQRAGAIVYDGTEDLDLWRPPGPDRDLLDAYGETLGTVLDKERAQLPKRRLGRKQAVRVHPGKLRCDFLVWVASRPPHDDEEAAPAPPLADIEALTLSALQLAAKHDVTRVAFGPLGMGRGAADASERMAAVVRGARAYEAGCIERGEAPAFEEVLVCAANAADIAKARRLSASLAKQAAPIAPRIERMVSSDRPPPARKPSTPRRGKAKLDPNELALAGTRAQPYDRSRSYQVGDWLAHATFGTGKVQELADGMVTVLFADGQERRLIHQR